MSRVEPKEHPSERRADFGRARREESSNRPDPDPGPTPSKAEGDEDVVNEALERQEN